MGAHLQRGVTPLTLPPSPNIARGTTDLEGSPVATNISKADPLPPSTPAARAIPNRVTQVIRLHTNAGGVPSALSLVDNVINAARPLLPFGSNLCVPALVAIGGDTSHTPPQRHPDHVAAQPGIRGIPGAGCPGPSIPRRRFNAARQNPPTVIVLSDDSDSDGCRKSTSVVHSSVNSDKSDTDLKYDDTKEDARTSVNTQGSAAQKWSGIAMTPNKLKANLSDYKGKWPM